MVGKRTLDKDGYVALVLGEGTRTEKHTSKPLAGVFKKANVVSANVPESGLALAAWVLIGVLALLGSLALAEVAVIVGKVGGNYAILRDAYGRWAGLAKTECGLHV